MMAFGEPVPAKPVLHITIKSSGLNKDYAAQTQRMIKKLTEKLEGEYHVIVTPIGRNGERNVEISSNVGFNAINLDCSKVEDLAKLIEVLDSSKEG